MQCERIDVVRLERLSEMRPITTAFEYKPANGWAWLQRLAIRVLRWRKCFACTEFVTYERHQIGRNGEDFMRHLFEQRKNLENNFNRKPSRLLIGAEDFAELMRQPPTTVGFDFRTEYYMSNGQDRKPSLCGLHVEVIPWMRGILVMP